MDACLFTCPGGVSAAMGCRLEILAAGQACGQRVWRPEFGMHVRTAGGLRTSGRIGVVESIGGPKPASNSERMRLPPANLNASLSRPRKDSPMDPTFLSATQLAALVRSGKVGALELLDHYIDRTERLDTRINAVVVRDFERARTSARTLDAQPDKSAPLFGVPTTVKESF